MLVAPALQDSPLKFWVSDADDAIARAQRVQERVDAAPQAEEGVAARGDTGEGDPLQAIQDALATFPADRIALFVHEGDARTYREDVDPDARPGSVRHPGRSGQRLTHGRLSRPPAVPAAGSRSRARTPPSRC